MKSSLKKNILFLRLDPDEGLIRSLKDVSEQYEIEVAFISSGIGMVKNPEMGFFCIEQNDYNKRVFHGVYDLNSIQGNITRLNNDIVPHIHITFNDEKFSTISGHLIECYCHITMEIFIDITNAKLDRRIVKGLPATRILCEGEHNGL